MKSVPPKEFESLPALDSPAGYICVIRDIDRDRYRIEATRMPKALIDKIVSEDDRDFGIELVSVLRTDDLSASADELYARHHARPSSEWLALDDLQLEELRQSALQIDAYASQYLTRKRLFLSDAAAPGRPNRHAASRASYGSSGARWRRLRPRSPIPSAKYGVAALRRNRRAAADRHRAERSYRQSTEDQIKEYLGEFFINHIIKISAIAFTLFFLLIVYAALSNRL